MQLSKLLDFKHHREAAYHRQSIGILERWHRALKAALMVHGPPRPQVLPLVLRTANDQEFAASSTELVNEENLRLSSDPVRNGRLASTQGCSAKTEVRC